MQYITKYPKTVTLMDGVKEKIYVKNSSTPHIENIRHSVHGPIISGVLDKDSRCLSLSSKSLNVLKISDGILKLHSFAF